jgi:tryptophan synthase alpha subunit
VQFCGQKDHDETDAHVSEMKRPAEASEACPYLGFQSSVTGARRTRRVALSICVEVRYFTSTPVAVGAEARGQPDLVAARGRHPVRTQSDERC